MITYQSLQETDLFVFFGAHEVDRNGDVVHLKTGGFQEHVDIRLWLDAGGAVQKARLELAREFVGHEGSLSPFAKDIAKSFVAYLTPKELRTHVSNVVFGIWKMKGERDEVVVLDPHQTDPPLPPSVPEDGWLLEVYAGCRDRCEKDLGDAVLRMVNEGPLLGIELEARQMAVAAS